MFRIIRNDGDTAVELDGEFATYGEAEAFVAVLDEGEYAILNEGPPFAPGDLILPATDHRRARAWRRAWRSYGPLIPIALGFGLCVGAAEILEELT